MEAEHAHDATLSDSDSDRDDDDGARRGEEGGGSGGEGGSAARGGGGRRDGEGGDEGDGDEAACGLDDSMASQCTVASNDVDSLLEQLARVKSSIRKARCPRPRA